MQPKFQPCRANAWFPCFLTRLVDTQTLSDTPGVHLAATPILSRLHIRSRPDARRAWCRSCPQCHTRDCTSHTCTSTLWGTGNACQTENPRRVSSGALSASLCSILSQGRSFEEFAKAPSAHAMTLCLANQKAMGGGMAAGASCRNQTKSKWRCRGVATIPMPVQPSGTPNRRRDWRETA